MGNGDHINEASHERNLISASAYIPGVTTPTLECAIDGNGIVVECNAWRAIQRSEAD